MKVLITGGRGYIGYITGRMLREQDHDVLLVDDMSTAIAGSMPLCGMRERACPIESEDMVDVLRSFAPDAILHCAAVTAVDEGEKRPLDYVYTNVEALARFLRYLPESQRIVFSSSCAVYDAPDRDPVSELYPLNPGSVYGWTKLFGERMLRWDAGVRKHRVAILRYFNVIGTAYGLAQAPRDSRIVPLAIQAAREDLPFTINGTDYWTRDGTCVRDYVHVLDIARAHVAALEALVREPAWGVQAINLGTGVGTSVVELVRAVQDVFDLPIRTVRGPRRAGDTPFAVASNCLADAVLGWRPKYSLSQAIQSIRDTMGGSSV